VEAYLLEHPETVEEFMGVEEWNLTESNEELPVHFSEEMAGKIKEKLDFTRPADIQRRVKIIRWMSVAASLLAIFFTVWMVQKKDFNNKNNAVTKTEVVKDSNGSSITGETSPLTAFIEKRNNSGSVQRILLKDGSVVFLDNNSVIRYKEDYNDSKREIYLTGAAYFEVAKDKTKPFIVYSSLLSTTAVGTSFRVSAFTGTNENISVKLYTGKVVVKSIDQLQGWHDNIYLSPGEKLVYDKKVMAVTVSRIGDHNYFQTYKVDNNTGEMSFNNCSLKEVITRLENKYRVVIHYSDKDVEGLNFTGKISKTDSLSVFLNLLANMNGMYIKEESGSYRIYKSQ
jgi:transmembrane sensor